MTPHPLPPADLASRRLPIVRIKATWWRIYSTAWDPIYFGSSGGNRFDAPADADGRRPFGVLYVGRDAHSAFIETFGHDTGKNLVEVARLAQRGIARVTFDRPLRLVDLRGDGLARLGADNALAAGPDYAVAQAWAGALHDHPRKPDGVMYRSRHDPSRSCAALFEHVAPHVRARRVGASLADPRNIKLLAELLDTYGFGLV